MHEDPPEGAVLGNASAVAWRLHCNNYSDSPSSPKSVRYAAMIRDVYAGERMSKVQNSLYITINETKQMNLLDDDDIFHEALICHNPIRPKAF